MYLVLIAELKSNIAIQNFCKNTIPRDGCLYSVDLLWYDTYQGLVIIKIVWCGIGAVKTWQQ